MEEKALEGVRVLELGHIYQGPYCGLLLAYMGADVVKVEPPEGERLRGRIGGRTPHEFLMLNSNKRSVALDLRSAGDKEAFLELVRAADVVIENYKPGAPERLGISYEDLKRVNERIVYASGKGYGSWGPYAEFPAMDVTIQALSGVIATTGFPDGPGVKAGPAVADFLGGVHLLAGILSALFRRERTGAGQHVEVSMHDCIYPTLASALGGLYNNAAHPERRPPQRTGNRHSGLSVAPYNVYETADGYIAVLCIAEGHWKALLGCMGREDLLADAELGTFVERMRRMDEVDDLVGGWMRDRRKWELAEELLAAGVPCAPVNDLEEVADDPHLRERGMILEVDAPDRGAVNVPGSPIRTPDTRTLEARCAPELGAHTREVLREWAGLSRGEGPEAG